MFFSENKERGRMMKKYVDLDAVLDVLAKDHAKRTDDQEAEILKVLDEIKKIPKANVVELPCEVGDKLSLVVNGAFLRDDLIVKKIEIRSYGSYIVTDNGIFSFNDVGKTIFTSREEAVMAREKFKQKKGE